MIKLLTIIGARPQIIKAAAISRAVQNYFSMQIKEHLLHTGQHYDANMSQVFFDELGIPKEEYNLHIGSASHGEQTAKMIEGIEAVLVQQTYDGVLIYGDTNSTLAGAVAATKLHIPVFHIEAGLRSYNRAMPEEINRIVADHLSSILFAPTQAAMKNLQQEGLADSPAVFRNAKKVQVFYSGDIMYDNSLYFSQLAEEKHSLMLAKLGIEKNKYILVTIHRDNNTDIPERLNNIFQALHHIASEEGYKIIIPLHPRTAKLLHSNLNAALLYSIEQCKNIKIIAPVSYLEMIMLEKHASLLMTDSGGVQKEAYFFKKPCVILRSETEWVEIVEHKAGIVADAITDKIINAFHILIKNKINFPALYGDGNATKFILEKIVNYLR
ncbi:MAG TPA: UDP-N-acetylglucosamine 2-epimerase (non-hydrolyzing) [Bacteroidales bacterium]|nr:UDP-N-acetylglucosamine 2-epimerase (non-hydrolyzing) [Bacteroidales bacterium]